MIYYNYNISKENIFIKINKERKFYIILNRFIILLIIAFIMFYILIFIRNFLINYIVEYNNTEIVPNVIIKPILQINDGLESKIEAIADKAFFIDKNNIGLENVIIKGNNDFILNAKTGNINTKNGEISLMERPITTIIND